MPKTKYKIENIGKPDIAALNKIEKQLFFDTLFSCIEKILQKEDSENTD